MLALVLWASALSVDYAALGALLHCGDRELARGEYATAARCYRAATELAPDSGAAWMRLSAFYRRTHNHEEARQAAYRAAQAGYPVDVQLFRPASVPILRDCWGNGGPCPPGTKPELSGARPQQ